MTDRWIPYCGAAPGPADLSWQWNLDPILLAALIALGAAYRHWSRQFGHERRAAFAAAWLLLALLYVSPLCALGSALFSGRAVHHVLLIGLVAPLLVASVPPTRLRVAPWLVLWTSLQTMVLWFWHAPAAYAFALSADGAFWAMQVTMLLAAMAFWAAVRDSALPAAIAALLATMVQMGLLGALITFAPYPLYAPHHLTTAAWGLTPLEDQQAAGLVMWAPAALVYLAAALRLAARALAPVPSPAR